MSDAESSSSPPVTREKNTSDGETPPPHRWLDRKAHPSAVDAWLLLMLGFPVVAAAAIGVYLMADGRAADASLMFLTGAAILGVTAIFTVPCRYTLLSDALSVRCGLICYQIPYESIREVKKSATLRSGPAMSLRRIVIQTDRRDYILSPVDRDRFIEQLNERIA